MRDGTDSRNALLRVCSTACVALSVLMALPEHLLAQTLRTCVEKAAVGTFGTYSGSPKVELLKNGRQVKLLEAFRYIDPCGKVWESPTGVVVDGASIPRLVWTIVGAPLEGKYRDASVIHDVACDNRLERWQLVHEAFFYAMRASGVESWRAKVMYAAVFHFGPRWLDPISRVKPPKPTLREKDFNDLATAIRVKETAPSFEGQQPLSLADIESWTPQ